MKRAYSSAFAATATKRLAISADRVSPVLKQQVQARCRKEGISERVLVLDLCTQWIAGTIALSGATKGLTASK